MAFDHRFPMALMTIDRMIDRTEISAEDKELLMDGSDNTMGPDQTDRAPIERPEDKTGPEGGTLQGIEPDVPSSVLSYFTETAISSKKRNSLPDEAFGLPRLRAYPLHDKAHIKQAVRMFGHCRDPKDQQVLANNIFRAIEKQKVSIKIGKNNPLYQYAPKTLLESNSLPNLSGDSSAVPLKDRTREDVVKEHLHVNGTYYNNIFYGEDYRKSVTALKQFSFMQVFYPNLTRMNFVTRLKCVCGGLASPEHADQIYTELKIRKPNELEFTKPLGWFQVASDADAESVADMLIHSNYSSEDNWFKVDLSDDLNHIFYCLRLYSIMGEIFLDPNFDPDIHLAAEHTAVLADWYQHVCYHYDLYRDADAETEQMIQRQYLWDLFWSFTDNPDDPSCITANVISMLRNMACVHDQAVNMNEANTPGELITKDQCSAYLVHDLGMTDDMYLIPSLMQYPIIDKDSVRLAMDMIDRIPAEQREEFSTNLNRKYREFGCNFSISIDHPYAKYADKAIITNMTHMLLEGETAVDDEGTSTGLTDKIEQPFYKRVDYMRGNLLKNLAQIKELGPNTKPTVELNHEHKLGIE